MRVLSPDQAAEYGFTKDLFSGWIAKIDNNIIISMIESKHPGRGDFSRFVQGLWDRGFTVQIPTPMGIMIDFVLGHGFTKSLVPFDPEIPEAGMVELWTKEAGK